MLMAMTARFIEKEYGEGALNALIDWKNNNNRRKWREISEETGRNDPEYLIRLYNESVHDYSILRKDSEVLEVVVKSCAHAENFIKFNAQDVGYKMICMSDFPVVEGYNPEMRLRREKTLMKGDDCCHFIFELKKRR
jgi:predicted ArsR family transcriptional regulator